MFSGIIQAVGTIKNIQTTSGGAKFTFAIYDFLKSSKIGDSIASNGVCLTIIEFGDDYFIADLSNETLSLTTFKTAKTFDKVNFEKSLRLSDGIDGHLVSGHIDGLGTITAITKLGDNIKIDIKIPQELDKYIAKKGSITLGGISLTVNEIIDNILSVNIVPHTFECTNLGSYKINDNINVEVDIVARHLEKLVDSNVSYVKK
jgi:riboflavin synthase